MKQTKLMFSIAVATAISALIFGIIGCEKDGETGSDLDSYFAANPYISDPRDEGRTSDGGLGISPETADVLTAGQRVVFTVSGGSEPITWGVASSAAGSITPQSDTRQAVYTATTVAPNNIIASDAGGNTAIASVNMKQPKNPTISPSSVDVNFPGTYTFTVAGGISPFTWTSFDASAGTVAAVGTGETATYTVTSLAGSTNINIITVIDANGNSGTANVR